MTKYAYARVSTADQNVSQQAQLLIRQYGLVPENVRTEFFTGKTTDRPILKKLIERELKQGDTLYIFHISRLGRKASEVLTLVDELKDRGIHLIVKELDSTDLTSPTGKLLVTMLAGLAEMELETLRERQRIGIDRAKGEGKYQGRKAVDSAVVVHASELKAKGMTMAAIAKQLNVGQSTLYRELAKVKQA